MLSLTDLGRLGAAQGADADNAAAMRALGAAAVADARGHADLSGALLRFGSLALSDWEAARRHARAERIADGDWGGGRNAARGRETWASVDRRRAAPLGLFPKSEKKSQGPVPRATGLGDAAHGPTIAPGVAGTRRPGPCRGTTGRPRDRSSDGRR